MPPPSVSWVGPLQVMALPTYSTGPWAGTSAEAGWEGRDSRLITPYILVKGIPEVWCQCHYSTPTHLHPRLTTPPLPQPDHLPTTPTHPLPEMATNWHIPLPMWVLGMSVCHMSQSQAARENVCLLLLKRACPQLRWFSPHCITLPP